MTKNCKAEKKYLEKFIKKIFINFLVFIFIAPKLFLITIFLPHIISSLREGMGRRRPSYGATLPRFCLITKNYKAEKKYLEKFIKKIFINFLVFIFIVPKLFLIIILLLHIISSLREGMGRRRPSYGATLPRFCLISKNYKAKRKYLEKLG